MDREVEPLQQALLIHLLEHRGQQVRFEADQWTTEFGIVRRFGQHDSGQIKQALRALEMARWIYRRVQYVIGYSEPKLVYSLTPSGHRKAVDLQRARAGAPAGGPTGPGEGPGGPPSGLPGLPPAPTPGG